MLLKEKLALIDNQTKLLVLGYFRDFERGIQSKGGNRINIPEEIADLCQVFAYEPEQFMPGARGLDVYSEDHPFDMNNKLILKEPGRWASSNGEYLVHCNQERNMIYEWIIIAAADCVSIGIDSSRGSVKNGYIFGSANDDGKYYAMGNDGVLEYQYSQKAWNSDRQGNGTGPSLMTLSASGIQRGDVVKMIFDVRERTLSFCINENDLGVAYEDIEDAIYNMAVSVKGLRSGSKENAEESEQYVKLTAFNVRYKE